MADASAPLQAPERAALPPRSVMSYRITPADARAWERRNPSQAKRNRVALGGALFAGAGLVSVLAQHLPDWLSSLHSTAVALAILFSPALLVLMVQNHDLKRRTRSGMATPVQVTLELWDKRLAEHRADRPAPLVLGAQAIRTVISTRNHVFVTARSGTIILPATAFADAQAKAAFLRHWSAMAG